MIKYLPSYIIGMRHACIFDSRQPNNNHLPLWEHFARLALDWNDNALECINNTSGIHNYYFHEFSTDDLVHKALARMFACAGSDSVSGEFLAHCGICKWADLAKPISVPGWDRSIPFDHDVRERMMRCPGPNECPPDAIYGQHCAMAFDTDRRWDFRVHYGYSHDSSSWNVCLRQNPGESLYHFGRRIPAFVESLFMPESEQSARGRVQNNRDYDRISAAVDTLFGTHYSKEGEKLVDDILAARRIEMTPLRYATLRKWARSKA